MPIKPTNKTPEQLAPRLTEEYVAGEGWGFYGSLTAQLLTPSHAEYYNQLSDEVVEMMMNDPVISSDYNLLVETVLADGAQIIPAVTDEEAEGYAIAQEAAQLCSDAVEGMKTDLGDLLEQMLEALKYGHRLAEVTYKQELNGSRSRLMLEYIKVKSRSAVQFVLDQYMNILGFVTGYYVDSKLSESERLIPRMKFFLFTVRKHNEDPRGQSVFRSLLCAWKQKVNAWPILERYMKLFAVPGLLGKPSPNSKSEVQFDSNGAPVMGADNKPVFITPQRAMLAALEKWENSTVVVVAPGAEVTPVQATGTGELFVNFFRLINGELTRGMLRQTRATAEAEHGSKADSQTGQDLFMTLVAYLKRRLANAFRADVLRVLVWLNFGEDAARRYVPAFQLGDEDRYDWSDDAQAITSFAPYVTDSQWDYLTMTAGLPAPKENETRPPREKTPPRGVLEDINPADPNKEPGKPDPKKPKQKAELQRVLFVRDVMRRKTVQLVLKGE